MSGVSRRTAELALTALAVAWRLSAPRRNGMAVPADWTRAVEELTLVVAESSPERTEFAFSGARRAPLVLSTDEAAQRLGVSVRAVQKRCVAGTLPARRVGRQWLVEWEGKAS